MAKWKIEIIEAAEAEIRTLPADLQGHFLHVAEMLEELGPMNVGMPHIRHLEGKLWEMRLKGKDGIARAIYLTAKSNRLIVVHAFIKKSQKTPRQAIELAAKRAKNLA